MPVKIKEYRIFNQHFLPVDANVTGCLGIPKRSSLRAFGCSKWGWSANGRASDIGVSNGSGGGQPRHKVDSDLCKTMLKQFENKFCV